MKKVLITGAAGFLGSHLMIHHLKNGDMVMGIDNYCSSKKNSDHVNLIRKLCRDNKSGALLEGDISVASNFSNRLLEFKMLGYDNDFDLIYNFACPASPPIYQDIPVLTTLTCVAGSANVFDVAAKSSAIVVHASTSEVYGDPTISPQKESYHGNVNSYGPRSCYDEGKRAAEALCHDYRLSHGVDVRLVRIFNTYGPHMDPNDGRVVSNFICQAIKRQNLTVYGDGQQTRSFCYVDDLIRGIIALGNLQENPGFPINLGNPNEFTILELANQVVKRLSGNIITRPLPKDDPLQRRPDISRAKEILNWEPKIQLSEGLDKTIEYFKNQVAYI